MLPRQSFWVRKNIQFEVSFQIIDSTFLICTLFAIALVPEFTKVYAKRGHLLLYSMLACYPLGLVMHLLPYGNIRHIYSFTTGLVLLQTIWGAHWIHTPITALISYAILRLCPRDVVQRIVPMFLMAYLAIAHLENQYHATNYFGMEIHFTCSQMILTQKLYMLAYNLHDGYLLTKSTGPENKTDDSALRAAQKCSKWALSECPTLLEFLGYSFCFSSVLVGPAIEFAHYRSACDGSLHYYIDKDGNKQLRGKKIPNNIIPTLVPFFKSFLLLVLNALFDNVCNYKQLASPFFFNLSFRERLFYNWLTNFVQRLKVYFTFLVAEGCNNIWYAGFDGYDKETGESKGWTVASGADIWRLETCESIKVGTRAWNKKTSQWLLRYVYIRNKGRLAIVYSVSAIWHGFYPGYYMLASIIWLMSQCERLGRKKISPYFSPKKWSIYGVTCIFSIHALGSYATTAFFLKSWENVMENWRAHYFWGHIACFVYYTVVSALPYPSKAESVVDRETLHVSSYDATLNTASGASQHPVATDTGSPNVSKRKYS